MLARLAHPAPGLDERLLIQRVLGGDERAARELYDAHVDRIYRLAYRLTGDDELARDCTQDTFIRAFQYLAEFRGASAFSTWLHSIAVSVCLNALRSVRRLRRRRADLAEADQVPSPDVRRLDPDLRERLHAAIDRLPDLYRVVFVMHDLEGYTHEEIGAVLGVPTGTSKARLSRARDRLRQALERFAGEWAV